MHIHSTAAEIDELLRAGVVEPLEGVANGNGRRVFRFKRMFAVRGVSARFGEEIARMLARQETRNFAQFLMGEVSKRGGREAAKPDLDGIDREQASALNSTLPVSIRMRTQKGVEIHSRFVDDEDACD